MSIGATTERREEYMEQLISWLTCGNHSWVDDAGRLDVENGGGAMGVAIASIHRIATKMAALPVEIVVPVLELV